jgi:RNA polymerase sigma factor (sigma-70 family)
MVAPRSGMRRTIVPADRNFDGVSGVFATMAAIGSPPPSLSPAMLAATDDDALVTLIADGDDDAFAALDARYRRRLVRLARGFVTSNADAEDAVQEAMVRAVRALRSNGKRPEAVAPWLHRIARNCALDVTGARRRHPMVELTDHLHPVAEDAEAAVERRLGVRGLVADVGELPDSQRSALVLRELEGRSYADIADELDTTVPAVKSLLVRARTGLRRARDQRAAAAAAWLPLPLMQRLADRLGALWEPVAATATPKVACAAVVVAGSLPVVAPHTDRTARPEPARTKVVATAPAPASSLAASTAKRAAASVAANSAVGDPIASTGAKPLPAGLQADCANGLIDGHWSHATLARALGTATAGEGEYASCVRALQSALLRS